MAIADPYEAYCFDEAVGVFGNAVSDELSDISGKNANAKRENHLRKRLGLPQKFAAPPITKAKKGGESNS